ncbi:MAG TPA: hypothetical protein VMJ32_07785 [Pirellulales bacterium]|nr:hypothetical protein [Pirellulales bacterium]
MGKRLNMAHFLIDAAILAVVVCGIFFWHELPTASFWIGCSAIILFVLGMAFFIQASLLNEPLPDINHAKANAGQSDNGQNSQGPASNPVAVQNESGANVQQHSEEHDQQRTAEHENNRIHGLDASVFASLLMALFTFFLVVCSAIGFAYQNRAINAAKQAAAAAEQNATSAKEAVEWAQKSTKIQDCAYLY